jgi:plastocyanin
MAAFKSTLLLALAAAANAQYGNSGSGSSSSTTSAAAAPSPVPSNVHIVTVAQNGLAFSPNSLTANPGDQVQFNWAQSAHSVAQSTFENPCAPVNASAFYSGFLNSVC